MWVVVAFVLVGWVGAANSQSLRQATVVLDAGHGGEDPGAIGVAEIHEKELTLIVTLLLRDRLAERYPDLRVLLTREDDSYPTLDDRANLANQAGADLFLSLHFNCAENPLAQGVETYWLDAAGTAPGEIVPGREHDGHDHPAAGPAPQGTLAHWILDDLVRDGAHRRSAELARLVQRDLLRATRAVDRNVRQGQFRVLRGVRMPAVVIEMGFLSHAREGVRVTEAAYHESLADALADAVGAWAEREASVAHAYGQGTPAVWHATRNVAPELSDAAQADLR